MNKACKSALLTVFAVTALVMATGCQSTGTATQPVVKTEPTPVESEMAASKTEPVPASSELKTVYFEYDRWQLRDDARAALRSNAQQLEKKGEQNVVTVAGHCDARGSEEYNLALGDRRAEAVKRYLVDLGIPASQVRTLSFGEARPAVPGEGETAWSRNRRAELSLGTQQASR